jgi:hypothetical protein
MGPSASEDLVTETVRSLDDMVAEFSVVCSSFVMSCFYSFRDNTFATNVYYHTS